MSYQREFPQRINVAVIGAGSHCYRNILPVMNYLPVRIKAICDPNVVLGKLTAEQYGCSYYQNTRELYERAEIEAVFICVGPKLHPQLVGEALDAGKHVWVEKPLATRAAEVAELITRRQDQIVVVGLKKVFMPATRKAVEIVNSPKYGNLRSILAAYHMTMPDNGKEILANRETPNWLRNGVHPLGFMMVVGGKVAAVTAICNHAGHGTVVLHFANGVLGNLHLASGPQPNLESYGVYGDKWQLEIKDTQITLQRGIPFIYKETANYAPEGDDSGALVWNTSNCLATLENKALFTQGFYDETKYFCDCILNKRVPQEGTLEFAWEMMRVYEAGMLSGGKTVYLD
jgi:predicted dehydrogenase